MAVHWKMSDRWMKESGGCFVCAAAPSRAQPCLHGILF